MNCDRFDERVQQLLDRREDPRDDWELVEHGCECLECGQSLTAVAWMVDRFHPASAVAPLPDGFMDQVLLACRQVATESGNPESEYSDSANTESNSLPSATPWLWVDRSSEATTVGAVQPLSRASQRAHARRQWVDWASPMALALVVVVAVLLVIRPTGSASPQREVAPRLAMVAPKFSAPFSLSILEGGVDRWTPVFDSIGDESFSVVRPITRSFHVAYDLIRQTLLGSPAGVPADARLDRLEDRWA